MMCRKRYTFGDMKFTMLFQAFSCRKRFKIFFAISQVRYHTFCDTDFCRIGGGFMDFGYVRVSTKDQNPARQIKILMDMGIEERNIYVEKKSGHNFERERYDMLVNHIMRPGDRLTVTELKRFGRNYREIYREWHHITKELGMDIRVADNKILDTSLNKDLLGQVITDVVLALLSYVAEGDWEERHELQRQGIETAKEAGKYLGRPRVEYPENWSECYGAWKEGSITAVEAMRRTGLKKDSFYRLVKKYEDGE